jgi:hypothetical protein
VPARRRGVGGDDRGGHAAAVFEGFDPWKGRPKPEPRASCTPVGNFHVPESEPVNRELRELVLDRERGDTQATRKSNVGGWHSHSDLMNWGGPAVGKLREWFAEAVNSMVVGEHGGFGHLGERRGFRPGGQGQNYHQCQLENAKCRMPYNWPPTTANSQPPNPTFFTT